MSTTESEQQDFKSMVEQKLSTPEGIKELAVIIGRSVIWYHREDPLYFAAMNVEFPTNPE